MKIRIRSKRGSPSTLKSIPKQACQTFSKNWLDTIKLNNDNYQMLASNQYPSYVSDAYSPNAQYDQDWDNDVRTNSTYCYSQNDDVAVYLSTSFDPSLDQCGNAFTITVNYSVTQVGTDTTASGQVTVNVHYDESGIRVSGSGGNTAQNGHVIAIAGGEQTSDGDGVDISLEGYLDNGTHGSVTVDECIYFDLCD